MKISIFWFRRDLRLEDNRGLYFALKGNAPVLPLFLFDTTILNELPDKKDARVEFILNEIHKLNKQLKYVNGSLLVRTGKPEKIFSDLISEFDVAAVYCNHDYEPYAIKRDNHIKKLLQKNSINFFSFKDQVIFEKDEVLNQSGGSYKVFTPYKNKWKDNLKKQDYNSISSEKINNYFLYKKSSIPSLKDIGFKEAGIHFPDASYPLSIIKSYDKTRNIPSIEGTTRLGIHLRFGTISIRKAVQLGLKYNETWLSELIWRDFFMQLLYHFPEVVDEPYNKKYKKLPWRYDDEEFEKWKEGKTGYPLVDAGMRQMNQTGFMHNRVRMVCGSFLAKHLLLDWRLGEKYFAEKLLDFELSSNNGNWQWVAGCGADAQPFIRIFNPTEQQKKFDPEFTYIKRWIPEFGTESYPPPMVDHKSAVARAKKAFTEIQD